MGDYFTRRHHSYSEPDGTLTVSDNITGFDMKMVLDALAFFNSEDCDYMYQELILVFRQFQFHLITKFYLF